MERWMGWMLPAAVVAAGMAVGPRVASACGCFAPPNPAEPVVQAGELIVFGQDGGDVTMHVQIQYQGPAEEFGWLLPMPSVPELELGSEELFSMLLRQTRPTFRLLQSVEGECALQGGNSVDAGAAFGADGGGAPASGPPDVLVRREAVGPFDTAVLRADDLSALLAWLNANRFFVPAAIDQVVVPYVRPGAYFLALKLLKDQEAGDIQPLVLRYASDLPMIPIVLTQVGATEDMPVTVWVLGEHRAIPRNYRHTVLNYEHIDWFSGGSNYIEVVTRAVDEADGHHSFVTELAGPAAPLQNILDAPQRFGERAELEAITDAAQYATRLQQVGFTFNATLINILRQTFARPEALHPRWSDEQFYANLAWFLGPYRQSNPREFEGADFSFDPVALTEAIWSRVVRPTLNAGALLKAHAKVTRLFTTLSPEEMTKDPVFSFNPDLPDVSNVHEATYRLRCDQGGPTSGELELPDGRIFMTTAAEWRNRSPAGVPFSSRIEILGEEGGPRVEVDNLSAMSPGDGPGTGRPGLDNGDREGCACSAEGAAPVGSLLLCSFFLALLGGRRRR